MLDPHRFVDLPDIPARAFRDDRRPQAFYLAPAAPSVARDECGQPSVNLTIYGRHVRGRFEAQGGVFTLTTALAVERQAAQQARAALSRWLAAEVDAAPAVEIFAIEWLSGEVTVRLTDRVRLSGRPSLTAPNTCAFNERIGRELIAGVAEAWHNGLPDGRIAYTMRARTSASAAVTSQTGEGTLFQFDGPIDIDRDALGGAMTTTSLES